MKLKGPRISLGGLTAAELARSILAAASGLRLGVLNQGHDVHRHAVAADGSLVFCPPLGTAEPPPALVTITVTDAASPAATPSGSAALGTASPRNARSSALSASEPRGEVVGEP